VGVLENIDKTGFLGSEFIKWLWHRSEMKNGMFEVKENNLGAVELWVHDRLKLEKGEADRRESLTYAGSITDLGEAKMALGKGKELKEAGVKLTIDGDEWFLTLDSRYLDIKSLKTPKTEKLSGGTAEEDDPESRFYERVFLIEKAVDVMDGLFAVFMAERTGPEWNRRTLPSIKKWRENYAGV
jgi:hypothetical protein